MATRVPGKLGRKMGRSLPEGKLQLENYLTTPLPLYNGSDDFTSGLVDWGMAGNDINGDCGLAGDYHKNMADTLTGHEAPLPVPDTGDVVCGQIVTEYYVYEGSPNGEINPAYDNGVDLGSWLTYRLTHKLAGLPEIGGFAQFDVTNHNLFQATIHAFGGIYVGILVSQEAMNEYSAGQPWTSTATDWIGGHCVPILGRNKLFGKAVTWGGVQEFDWPWWRAAREEAFVIFTPAMMEAPGGKWNGIDVVGLKAELAALAATPVPPNQQD